MRRSISPLLAVLVFPLLACGSPGEPAGSADLRFISPPPALDTIGAPVTAPLEAVLLDESGDPMAAVEIQWSTDDEIGFARQAGAAVSSQMRDTTDAQGLTSALLYRGYQAGDATIRIFAAAIGEGDSLRFTIAPGNPASVDALPADTALRVGAGFRLRATVLDRAGNQRNEVAALAALPGGTGLVVVDTDSLDAREVGRVAVEASFGGGKDTAWVSVVPDGSLAAFLNAPNTGARDELVTFETDGRAWQIVWQSPFHVSYKGALAWHPSGQRLAFVDMLAVPDYQIFEVDLQGTLSEAVSPTESQPANLAPLYSFDGAWLYYSGVNFPVNGGAALYRISGNGEVERLTSWTSFYTTDSEPSPSPDGSLVAFVTDRPDDDPSRSDLAILTVADEGIQLLGLPARTPRWSPIGDLIAFLRDGQVWLIDPDGSNPRLLASEESPYSPGLSWSSDGKWLVAANEHGVRLIEAASGMILPLAFTRGYAAPAWRP